MSYDRAARHSQMDRATDSMASHGWIDANTAQEPSNSMPPVRTSDMARILEDVAWTRNRPVGETHSASELAYGSIGSAVTSPYSNTGPHADATLHVGAAGPVNVAQAHSAHAKHADWRSLRHTLEQSAAQLRIASGRLADWTLNHHLGAAMRWVEKHRDGVAATPDTTLEAWTPIIAAQSVVLFDAGGDIGEIVAQARKTRMRPGTPEAAPFHEVLEAYAVAIGEAHESSNPQGRLADARRLHAKLALELMDQTLRVNANLTREMAATVPDGPDEHGVRQVETARGATRTLEAGGRELWEKYRSGGGIDPKALEGTVMGAKEQIIIARAAILQTKVGELAAAAEQATQGMVASNANVFNDDVRNVKAALYAALPEISTIVSKMRDEAVPKGPFPDDHAMTQQMFADARRRAVANANAALAEVSEKHNLEALFKRAVAHIEHAQRNTRYAELVIEIAELIGISVISSGIASGAAFAARGLILAEAAVDTAEFARTAALARGVGAATGLVTDVGLQSGGQMLVDGHSSFGEAALTNLLTLGVLRPFHTAVGKLGGLDAEARGLWKVASGGKVVLTAAGTLTVETLVGAGASYVAARIVEGKSPPDALTASAWAEHAQLLQDEHALLSDPAAVARLHLDPQQLRSLRTGNSTALAETQGQAFGVMRLRFHGLEPLSATGDLWSGTRAQLEIVLADSGGAVHNVTRVGDGEWTARVGGRETKFVEIAHRSRSDNRPPSPAEAEANRAIAAQARKINAQRSQKMTELVYAAEHPKFRHITVGEGVAASLSHSSQHHGPGVKPGALTELPESIAISDHPDWWGILGDREIGQPVTDWSSSAYRWQPGAFNADHQNLGRASDVANANAITALESGMAVVRGRVTEIEQFKAGTHWPVDAKWRAKIDDKKWVYADSIDESGGLGVPNKVDSLNSVEAAMKAAGRFVYAQEKLIPNVSAGGTIVIFGDSGTAGWAVQDAIAAGCNAILIVNDFTMPKMPDRLREFVAKHKVRIVHQNDTKRFEWSNQKLSFMIGNDSYVVDGVSVAAGQTTVMPKGMDELRFRMVTVSADDGQSRVVALESFDESSGRATGLTVQGAAMTARPFRQGALVQDVADYNRRLAAQAAATDVPIDSRGVEPSIHQSARNIPLSNGRVP